MVVLLRFSQSSILPPQLHQFRRGFPALTYARLSRNRSELSSLSPSFCARRQPRPQQEKSLLRWAAGTPRVVSDSKEDIEKIQLEDTTGGGDDGIGGGEGGEGGGGGGDNNDSNEGEGGSDESDNNKKIGMSMSQKLTLAYAALIGVGGVMGYLKSGSTKSLVSGGLSALLLLFVYTELPTRPAFASSLGFGLSAALLVVMGSRFKKSGKIFPAGVVSFVSLVMTGGYIHGILRSLH